MLLQRGVSREVVARQLGKAEVAVRREFPGHVEFHASRHRLCAGHQFGGAGFLKLEQDVGGLDLDTFARVKLDLGRRVGLGEHAPGQKFAGFFK